MFVTAFSSSSSGLSSLVHRTFSASSWSLFKGPSATGCSALHGTLTAVLQTSTAIALTTITKHLTNKNKKKEVDEPMGFHQTDPQVTHTIQANWTHLYLANFNQLSLLFHRCGQCISLFGASLTSELSTGF